MRPKLTFVDQTLGVAATSGCGALDTTTRCLGKISETVPLLLDLPLALLADGAVRSELSRNELRAELPIDPEALEQAAAWGCGRVMIKPGLRDGAVMPLLQEFLTTAAAMGLRVTVYGGELGSQPRESLDRLKSLGCFPAVTGFIVDDPGSRLDPFAVRRIITEMRAFFQGELEFWGRNRLGLATANAMAAAGAGATKLATAVGGVGQFPALEEVLLGLGQLLRWALPVPPALAQDCHAVLESIAQTPAPTKAIIGADIFAHESGIHVDGVIKRSELYEPFPPETVGLERKIVIGKHSGTAALELKLRALRIPVEPEQLPHILEGVRRLAIVQKAPVIDEQLRELARGV